MHVVGGLPVGPGFTLGGGIKGIQDMTVELRNIKVARAEGEDTVVAGGLQPGDQVVTVGQLRLAPGTKVNPAKAQTS